jgi:polar amino acid transport system substrate-binding protein
LGIAVNAQQGSPWFTVIKKFLSPAFIKVVGTLVLLLLGVGALVWWFERKRNPDQFGKGTASGIGSGFWWSAVTMTTVGYGDKAPVTPAGRFLALVWMFVSIIIISGFTAAITASLTVSELGSVVKGPQDLINVRVGAIPGTTSFEYLEKNHLSFQKFASVEEGLDALNRGRIDAFVYDSPVLRYIIKRNFPASLMVLPQTFEQQNYGIALPNGSPLREPINRILLKEIREKDWQDVLYRYLGR